MKIACASSNACSDARPWRSRFSKRRWSEREQKTDFAQCLAARARYPVRRIAKALGVSRSHLPARLQGDARPRRRYQKAQDAALLPVIRRLVDTRPTYGYRRITALLRRELAKGDRPRVNHKRVYRIMKHNGLLLARHSARRPGRLHGGHVVVMRSNLRWCSDVLELSCWNCETVRIAFVIDAHDREIIAWRAVVGMGISGSEVRGLKLETVESRNVSQR